MKTLSKRYWCERVIEIPEHYYDWLAPRWYVAVVILAYLLMIVVCIMGCARNASDGTYHAASTAVVDIGDTCLIEYYKYEKVNGCTIQDTKIEEFVVVGILAEHIKGKFSDGDYRWMRVGNNIFCKRRAGVAGR